MSQNVSWLPRPSRCVQLFEQLVGERSAISAPIAPLACLHTTMTRCVFRTVAAMASHHTGIVIAIDDFETENAFSLSNGVLGRAAATSVR